MVKTKFKKAVSLMLAAVMSLTAFMGIGATTAFAAVGEKADVYLVDYPRSGDTNNLSLIHIFLKENAPYAKANIAPYSPAWLLPITQSKKD